MRTLAWRIAAVALVSMAVACGDDGASGETDDDSDTGSSTSASTSETTTGMTDGTSESTTTASATETTTTDSTTDPTTEGSSGTTGASGQPVAVAVGYGARRVRSTDGTTWDNFVEINPNGGDDNDLLRGVAYGGGNFVAVGGAQMGLSFSSSDGGVTWDNENRTARAFVSDAAYFGEEFIAVGGNGLRIRTADLGANWEDDAGFAMGHFRAVATNDEVVVAVGHTYQNVGQWSTTEDGVTWTEIQTGGSAFRDVAFGAGVFVAVGDGGRISTSANGTGWQDETIAGNPNLPTVLFADDTFYVSDAGRYWTSEDGAEWTEMTQMTARPLVGWFAGSFFSTGIDATINASADLASWDTVFMMTGGALTAVASGPVD